MENYNPFFNILPSIDLHGFYRDMVKAVLYEFIDDNYKLGNKKIIVIHGKGTGVIKNEVHRLLNINKKVNTYYLDAFNIGETIIELK